MKNRFRQNKLLRYIKDVVFPVQKAHLNTRTLDYLKLVLRSKHNAVVIAAIPRSGSSWCSTVLDAYFRRVYDIPHRVVQPADARAKDLDLTQYGLPVKYIFSTHQWWGYSPLGLKNCKRYVFLYRDLPTALYSLYHRKTTADKIPSMVSRNPKWPGIIELIRKATSSQCFICNYRNLRTEPLTWYGSLIQYLVNEVDWPTLSAILDELSFNKAPMSNAYKGAPSYREEMGEAVYEELIRLGVSYHD